MADTVRLFVGGKEYGGWKTARVTRGIESIAGGFELDVSERWATQDQPWPIFEEDECSLKIGTTKVITGYVDRRRLSYDSRSHSLCVSGRDKTGALVDCSADVGKWEFHNIDVLTFVKRLCEPFGVSASLLAGLVLPKLPKVSIEPGETAFEAIDKACRMAAILPVSDGDGGLLLTRSGDTLCPTELVYGENILAGSGVFDATGRFRTVKVRGQRQGTDEDYGESAAVVSGSATDMNVRRSERVLIVRAEGNTDAARAKTRAQWEAAVRASRGDAVTVTVQGWTMGNGDLWPVNALVRVRDPLLGVNGMMLITQVTYSLDDRSGSTAQISLRRQSAFTPESVITTQSSGLWKEIAGGV